MPFLFVVWHVTRTDSVVVVVTVVVSCVLLVTTCGVVVRRPCGLSVVALTCNAVVFTVALATDTPV